MIKHLNESIAKPFRVIIIGAFGFLGKKLNSYLSGKSIKTVQLDLPDFDLLQLQCVEQLQTIVQPNDVIVFTSALTPDKGKDRATMLKNITMGNHLCQFLESTDCAQVVYISSDAVYGSSEELRRETSCCQPCDLYGLGHLVREEIIKAAVKKRDISLVILRSCAIYGNGDTHNSYGPNLFMRSALKNQKITLFGNGEDKRSHIFIGDVIRIIELCLINKSVGILNITSGKSISFMELAKTVSALFEKNIKIQCTPRQNPITYIHFDPTELIMAFPKFEFTSLEDGLATFQIN